MLILFVLYQPSETLIGGIGMAGALKRPIIRAGVNHMLHRGIGRRGGIGGLGGIGGIGYGGGLLGAANPDDGQSTDDATIEQQDAGVIVGSPYAGAEEVVVGSPYQGQEDAIVSAIYQGHDDAVLGSPYYGGGVAEVMSYDPYAIYDFNMPHPSEYARQMNEPTTLWYMPIDQSADMHEQMDEHPQYWSTMHGMVGSEHNYMYPEGVEDSMDAVSSYLILNIWELLSLPVLYIYMYDFVDANRRFCLSSERARRTGQ